MSPAWIAVHELVHLFVFLLRESSILRWSRAFVCTQDSAMRGWASMMADSIASAPSLSSAFASQTYMLPGPSCSEFVHGCYLKNSCYDLWICRSADWMGLLRSWPSLKLVPRSIFLISTCASCARLDLWASPVDLVVSPRLILALGAVGGLLGRTYCNYFDFEWHQSDSVGFCARQHLNFEVVVAVGSDFEATNCGCHNWPLPAITASSRLHLVHSECLQSTPRVSWYSTCSAFCSVS